MIRTFFAILTLWALLASPGLCLAGLMEHACADAPETEASCGHEETCAEDPCLDSPILPHSERNKDRTALLAAPLEQAVEVMSGATNPATVGENMPPAYGNSLPVHESDLPLLR
jgi:hypothetical protein